MTSHIDPFDHEITRACTEPAQRRRAPRLLFVGGIELAPPLMSRFRERGCSCALATRLTDACAKTAESRFDLIVVDPDLPDGDGLELIRALSKESPSTKTIVVSRGGRVDDAIRAMRSGAVDFVRTPVELDEFAERLEAALQLSDVAAQSERRFSRLKRICTELNTAREEISEQVDALCAELAAAYEDMSEQLDTVAMTTEFRTLLRQELDVEEMLRTALEYLLTQTGPTNAAVFLPDGGDRYALGAYVNYDCPRDSVATLLDHLCHAICPQMTAEYDIVSFSDARDFAEWIGIEEGLLADSEVLAFSCHHEGECLAILVLFRHSSTPFDAELAEALDRMRTIFGEQLGRLIRIHHRSRPEWPKDIEDDDGDWFEDDDFGLAA